MSFTKKIKNKLIISSTEGLFKPPKNRGTNIRRKVQNTLKIQRTGQRQGQENSKPMIVTDAVDPPPICKEQEPRMTEAIFLWSFSSKSKYKYDTGCKYIHHKHEYPSASWSYTSKNLNDGNCLFFKVFLTILLLSQDPSFHPCLVCCKI